MSYNNAITNTHFCKRLDQLGISFFGKKISSRALNLWFMQNGYKGQRDRDTWSRKRGSYQEAYYYVCDEYKDCFVVDGFNIKCDLKDSRRTSIKISYPYGNDYIIARLKEEFGGDANGRQGEGN